MLSRQANQAAPPVKELTMRHAVVTTHLIHTARAAGPRVPERALVDAPPDVPAVRKRRSRRRLARRLTRRPTTA
jgi:hypothetical protein